MQATTSRTQLYPKTTASGTNGRPINNAVQGDYRIIRFGEGSISVTTKGLWRGDEPIGEMHEIAVDENMTTDYKGVMKKNDQGSLVLHGKGIRQATCRLGKWDLLQEGEWKDGQFSGEGKTTNTKYFPGGKRVVKLKEGTFFNGRALVNGIIKTTILENGKVIQECIQYRDGHSGTKKEPGAITWFNKNTYEGEVHDGEAHGTGTLKFANGDVYEGQFDHDKLHGNGVITWKSGDRKGHRYEGDFKDGQRMGWGTYIFSCETPGSEVRVYGEWEKGKLIKLCLSDGRIYTGEFNARFEPCGRGTYVRSDEKKPAGNGTESGKERTKELSVFYVMGLPPDKPFTQPPISHDFSSQPVIPKKHGEDNAQNEITLTLIAEPIRSVPEPITAETKERTLQPGKEPTAVKQALPKIVPVALPVKPALPEPAEAVVKSGGLNSTVTSFSTPFGEYKGQSNDAQVMHGLGTLRGKDGTNYTGEWDGGAPIDVEIDYPGGANYRGKLNKDHQREGEGVLTLKDGTACRGKWAGNNPTKKMTTTFPDGSTFVGEVKIETEVPGGEKHQKAQPICKIELNGKGTLTLANGNKVQGEWINGELNRQKVTMLFADGSIFSGSINAHDQPDGDGIYTVANQFQYQGQFKNGIFDGPGKRQSDTGISYEGIFKEGMLEPIGARIKMGELTYLPLSNYNENTIVEMTFEGEILFGEQGPCYTGWIAHGQASGPGMYVIPNEFVYDGTFLRGAYHGKGSMYFNNGDYLGGEFTNGEINGSGVYYDSSTETTYHANFNPETWASLTVEKAEMWRRGDHFIGALKDGEPYGPGIFTSAAGNVLKGIFGNEA